MDDCIFCEIIKGNISRKVGETDELFAFEDIAPVAPTHILIIPKEHIATLNDLEPRHAGLVGKMFLYAKQIADERKIADTGWRTVFNVNKDAGQTVFHIHLHILGGRQMSWPPG